MGRSRRHAAMLPKGVAVIRRKGGRLDYYWYPGRNTPAAEWLREQWCKLPGNPDSPEFWQALQRAREGKKAEAGGIALMVDAYLASDDWEKLSERTRRDYKRYLDDFRGSFGDMATADFDTFAVVDLRDAYAKTPSKADHYVAVIRALYSWGIGKKHAKTNPAREIDPIAKVKPYIPWPDWAWETVPLMRQELRVACYLGLYTGQRLSDVLQMRLQDVEDGRIKVIQRKTGTPLTIRLHSELAPIVDECRSEGRMFLVSRRDGTCFTEDQFHAMWGREKRKEALKRFAEARPSLVFHGLRKSATCKLIEAGCTVPEVQSVTGMSLSMVEHYAKKVNQPKLADKAMEKMERA